MIKKVIVSICLLFACIATAQENNASPYSYYGIGDMKFKGTAENRSMGGIGILPDSIHVNLQNPASYAHLKLTTFTVGGTNTITNFKSDTGEDKANRVTLDYLAVALPFNKVGVTFGLMPYTSVGYKLRNTTTGDDGFTRLSQFNGSGGLNRVFFGAAYRITPNFSIGADFQYYFGNIETKSIISMPSLGVQYPVRELNKSDYSGASAILGAMYSAKLNQKYSWYTSATFTPSTSLRTDTDREISSILLSPEGAESTVDQINVAITDENVKMPAKVTLGSGIGQDRKWFAGAEYTFQQSNELGNRFETGANAGFEEAHRVSLGGYIIPDYTSFTSYFKRITYRAGLKYEKSGLVINNEPINDYGFTLGLGLPLGGAIGGSNLNLGMEMGRRGTTNANLIQENYINIFVSISLNDRWFVKRRYD